MEQEILSSNMDPSHPAYNIDWIMGPMGDYHATQSRDWSTSYTPYSSEVTTVRDKHFSVVGFGTVHLPLQAKRDKDPPPQSETENQAVTESSTTPSRRSSILVLHNVLHIPGLSYNYVSSPRLAASRMYTIQGNKTPIIKDKATGTRVGFTEATPSVPKFRLAGQKAGVMSYNASSKSELFDFEGKEKQRWQKTIRDLETQEVSSAAKVPEDTQSDGEKGKESVK